MAEAAAAQVTNRVASAAWLRSDEMDVNDFICKSYKIDEYAAIQTRFKSKIRAKK
ncbi:hypothetical protein [Rhodoferax sp. PAMC 29310]|uniref:hypothetical protein n=1 Tax=Rhodoferax sp. PAMC 29310 TaxID=2822760 RepID=UPI001F0B1A37|nr:hypothetical protein [Rhodoferax sp. PAMC 29310]